MRSLRNVRDVRLGFDADSVLLVEPALRGVKLDSAQIVALRHRLLTASLTVPGIQHASSQHSVPFGGMSSWPILVEGIDSVRSFGRFDLNAVSPDYFATMGTRILRGRGIERSDVAGARRVMVIGASMGRVLWPGQDPWANVCAWAFSRTRCRARMSSVSPRTLLLVVVVASVIPAERRSPGRPRTRYARSTGTSGCP